MIQELETLAKLPPSVRADIERYCANRGYAYAAILSADRGSIWEMGRLHGLIVHLGRRGHKLREIHTAAGVTQQYAQRVLELAREQETPIKTTDWERIATCRR